MNELFSVINHSITITLFVFLMMLIIDYLNVATQGKMEKSLKGGKGRQYTIASFLGATPGCLGAFLNVSFYAHGLMGFGAIVGGMIATSGDEAFVMLALFPEKALLLFSILFMLGILGAWVSDKVASRVGIIPCKECDLQVVHPDDNCRCFDLSIFKKNSKITPLRYGIFLFLLLIIVILGLGIIGPETWNWKKVTIFSALLLVIFILITVPDHYIKEHIWNHIIKKHLLRVFLWTFFALLFINIGFKHWNIEAFVRSNMEWVFLISALLGLIPESGPHMVFVMMFANGIVPFSILLTSSIVQDGHGMLPLFSYSVKDALLIKLFNLLFAIIIGLPLLLIGW
jgi:hypothetical protein